eukprot:SM000193S05183  [mRNA]  locus=s193:198794:200332:- [translate_table: standard]
MGCRHRWLREGLEAAFHPLDIGSDDSVAAFANWVGDTYGAVHILVNNAGMGGEPASVNALHTDVATFNDVHNVNVTGALRMIKAFMPAMKKANYGRIVNVSSAAGQFGFMGNSSVAYSASKAGLNALTVMFGKAVEADEDIAVVAMCPGPVRTRLAEEHNGLDESIPKALGHKGWKEPDSIGHEVLHIIDLKKEKANGKFFRDNKLISWI